MAALLHLTLAVLARHVLGVVDRDVVVGTSYFGANRFSCVDGIHAAEGQGKDRGRCQVIVDVTQHSEKQSFAECENGVAVTRR